ncbi:MAG: hypothetical protein P4L87_23250 [Formivibrio sp.]|nr:hypothetical protein [Formivibrio sp.]
MLETGFLNRFACRPSSDEQWGGMASDGAPGNAGFSIESIELEAATVRGGVKHPQGDADHRQAMWF